MTKDETTWWLMPDRVVQDVKVMLKCAIEKVDDRCGETGCMCDLRGSYCSQPYQDALNAVESGLRKDELIGRLKKLAKEWRIRANEYDLKGWKSGSAWDEEIELMKGGYCEGCKGVLFIHETGCYEKCSGFINKLKNIRKEVL